ncbi:MAG: cytochrome c maturation protein CcmE [Gammaproteobacteria bacterium]|jgi:cytochrome c-type biogenesis protein CcmE
MKARRKRMLFIGTVLAGVAAAIALSTLAFRNNLLFFFSPTQIANGEAPTERQFRLGGMVLDGSLARADGSLTVDFIVTDNVHTVPVSYTGILPDLFQEGQGVVAVGRIDGSGHFTADQIIAKHDENYMPPEVAAALEAAEAAQAGDGS